MDGDSVLFFILFFFVYLKKKNAAQSSRLQFWGTVTDIFLFLGIWHYVHSIAILSRSISGPLLYFFYPSLQFWGLLRLFQSSRRELQSPWNFSDSFVFPLPQWAKCSVEWQGLFMTKVPSMSICPQREAQLQGHALLWMPDPTPISSNEHYVCHCCLFWAIAAGREAFCHPSHHHKPLLTHLPLL